MQWAHYWRNVVSRYQVVVERWPDEIPFDNLSKAASGITALENLKERWRSGETAWRQLDDDEFQELNDKRNSKVGSGEVVEHRRRPRSDKGKKRRRALSPKENVTSRPRKKAYTSPATVEDEDDTDSNPVVSRNNSTLNAAKDITPVISRNNPTLNTAKDITPIISHNDSTLNTAMASTPIVSHSNSALSTVPLNEVPFSQAGLCDDLFQPLASTSASGLYVPGSTDFIDNLIADFDYEQAIAGLNELLSGGPA
jgi:hypothetical protein